MSKQGINRDEQRIYRNALGQFPTGVAIVTALGDNAQPIGMTINSFTSISMSPALVAWSIDSSAASCEIFAAANGYTITVLAQNQADLSMRFATRGIDKFQGIRCNAIEPPAIPGGCAWFKCEAQRSIRLGDHYLLVGHVLDFAQNPTLQPLVFSDGQFQSLLPAMASTDRAAA
jgi:flavin reductase (DIM6/NTAB) family NADH-FMN oxidoreductase RutF